MKNRVFIVFSLTALLGLLYSCSDKSPTNPGDTNSTDSVKVNVTPIVSVTASQPKQIQGTIVANKVPFVTYAILDKNKIPVTNNTISIQSQPSNKTTIDLANDAHLAINSTLQACNNNYYLLVTATAGDASDFDTIPFALSGGKNCSLTDSVKIVVNPIIGVTASQPKQIQGTIVANKVPVVTYTILDKDKIPVTTNTISIQSQPSNKTTIDLANDAHLAINSTLQACNNNYYLIVKATAGDATDFDTIPFALSGGKNCGLVENVAITLDTINPITAGQTGYINGLVQGTSTPINVSYTLLDSSYLPATGTAIILSSTAVTNNTLINLGSDAHVVITTTSTACNGKYYLKIIAISGTVSDTIVKGFVVTGGQNCNSSVNTDTLRLVRDTLGSWQNATYGHAFDADLQKTYKDSALTPAIQAEIDIWCANQVNGAALWSPSSASAGKYGTQNWTTKNITKLVKVTANFALITTQIQINGLWDATNAKSNLLIAAGDVIIVNTNQNKFRILKIISAENDNVGKVVIESK